MYATFYASNPTIRPFAKFGIDTNVFTMSGGIDDKVCVVCRVHKYIYIYK